MQITTENIELHVDDSLMRVYVAAPKPQGKYPGVLLYSEIFQLTGPILRSVNRLAGHGFVVAAPEIYHRTVPPGLVIGYDDIGRMYGNDLAKQTAVAAFDADAKATFDYLLTRPDVASSASGGQLATMGFCIGGHLALRAALDPRCRAAACAYPTGVHSGKLGKDADAGTLKRLSEIKGELLVVFGDSDPHIPKEGRKILAEALKSSGIRYTLTEVPGAEHAFMRDEGPRYDSATADLVYAETVALFKRTFGA